MRKKGISRIVAVFVCLAFLGITASGLMAAPDKAPRLSARLLFKKPVQFLVAVFPALQSLFPEETLQADESATDTDQVVKPTGEIKIIRISVKD